MAAKKGKGMEGMGGGLAGFSASNLVIETTVPVPATQPKPEPPASVVAKPKGKRKRKETLTTVNIKITRSQQRWLQNSAQQVRDNNDEPVPPDLRCYPQHLIGVAIDLLKAQDIDWQGVKTADDIREVLNL